MNRLAATRVSARSAGGRPPRRTARSARAAVAVSLWRVNSQLRKKKKERRKKAGFRASGALEHAGEGEEDGNEHLVCDTGRWLLR